MYSLYRAWLSLGPCGALPTALPSLASTSALSVPLNLSAPSSHHQLPGVPDVALQVGPTMTQFSAHKAVLSNHSGFFKAALTNHTGNTPIAVPNVNVDEFSSLLTFMYTGYLDLNIRNIYNILLATHMLHMPRALELCRIFLLQSQPVTPYENRTNIIKPIPSRKVVLPTQQIFAPTSTYSNLEKHEDTPFKVVVTNTEKCDINQASTSKQNEDTERIVIDKKSEEKKMIPERSKHKKHRSDSNNTEKVIIDIACCDGPVRFHRVVNKNYGVQQQQSASENHLEITQQEINRNAVMNKVMNDNIREKQMSDENLNNHQPNQNNELFTCLYCNHTFKSQYCYQKHARRHLNPVSMEPKTAPKENVKREVKLLDMNVQYYPCKSCGSKFPSYYFVHKHRKMCHAEEMADNTNKNNEMVPETANSCSVVVDSNISENNSNSNIDVEAINTEN